MIIKKKRKTLSKPFFPINFKVDLFFCIFIELSFCFSIFAKKGIKLSSNAKRVILMFLKTLNVNFETIKVCYKK